jgi:NitT/TauT family transport system permease protein
MPYVVVVLLLVLWEVLNRLTNISSVILPAPSTIFSALIRYHEVIAENAVHTFVTAMIGFALGVVTGVVIGFATGISPAIYAASIRCSLHSMPFEGGPAAAFVLWAGIGMVPAVLTADAGVLSYRRQCSHRVGDHRRK